MTGVTEKTVPDCVFCKRAIMSASEVLPSAINVSCSEDLATCGTSLKTSTFGVHFSSSGLPLSSSSTFFSGGTDSPFSAVYTDRESLPSSSSNFAEIGTAPPLAACRTPASRLTLLLPRASISACASVESSALAEGVPRMPDSAMNMPNVKIDPTFPDCMDFSLKALGSAIRGGQGNRGWRGYETHSPAGHDRAPHHKRAN